MMLTRCPDETMVAWQAWRRGRRLGRRYRHGAGKRAKGAVLGWSIDVAGAPAGLESAAAAKKFPATGVK